jgi:hypothetical protein
MVRTGSQSVHTTIFLTYTPQSSLAAFVDTLWLYESYRSAHTKERRLHTVTPYLIVQEAARLIDFMKEAFGATEHFRDTGSGREVYISLHSS